MVIVRLKHPLVERTRTMQTMLSALFGAGFRRTMGSLQSPPATFPSMVRAVMSVNKMPAMGLVTLVTSQKAGVNTWSSNLGVRVFVSPGSRSMRKRPMESVKIFGLKDSPLTRISTF